MRMSRDSGRNLDKALAMVGKAAGKGAKVVCLPELFNVPYFPQYLKSDTASTGTPNSVIAALAEGAKNYGVVLIGGSIYEKAGGKSYNTSFVFSERGKILGRYRKVHLPQDYCFYEQSYFNPGDTYRIFNTSFGRIAVQICFDQWYPEAARAVKLMGADMLLYPTAIGTVRGVAQTEGNWQEAWEGVQRGHAISNSLVVGAANRVGLEGNLSFWGSSFVFDQFGKTVSRADRREQVLVAECDLELAKEIEEGWGFLRNRRPGTYSKLVE